MIFTKAEAYIFYLDVVNELGQFVPNAEKLNKIAESFLSKHGLDHNPAQRDYGKHTFFFL